MSVWLLIGAGMVGFAAAWLMFELWRAWTPDAIRAQSTVTPDVTRELEQLRRQVSELQREIDMLRGGARAPTAPPVPIDPVPVDPVPIDPVPMETYEPAAPARPREVYDTRARQRVREQPQW